MEKKLFYFFLYTVSKEIRIIIFSYILSRFSFVSNATNFCVHFLNWFVFEETAYALLVFFNRVPCMQICPLNSCKLDREEDLFDFSLEPIASAIKAIINVTSI